VHRARLALICLLATALLGCKIVVTVPEGGKVVTEDGFVCLAGEVCIIEVRDDNFESTFAAMPLAGYTFARWARKRGAFCGNVTTPCHLSTLVFSAFPALMEVLASDQEFHLEPVFVNYDLGYWQQVLKEIDDGTFATRSFLYEITPDVGNCDPGALKERARFRARDALNHTRALHRLPMVEYDSFYDMQVQEASLVQRANNYLNHFPSPGDNCYTAAAEEGAGTSNLGSGSKPSDPAADVFGWTNDNHNLAALMEAGHRRWMLYPELGYTSYGQVEGFTALKTFSFGRPPMLPASPDLEYVAMPYRYYPYVLMSRGDKPTPWSLSMVPPGGGSGSFDYFSNARVEVIDIETGASLPVRDRHTDAKGSGLANFLSWMVDGWDYDSRYTVRISDIRMPGGEVRNIEYAVVVDWYHLFNVDHPREATDSISRNTLKGSFNFAMDKDSYRAPYFKGPFSVAGESNFSNMAFFILVYDQDKRLLKSSDQAFEIDFPLGANTVIVSACDENGLCYQGTQSYTVTLTPR
jgi:hypothetical protein